MKKKLTFYDFITFKTYFLWAVFCVCMLLFNIDEIDFDSITAS